MNNNDFINFGAEVVKNNIKDFLKGIFDFSKDKYKTMLTNSGEAYENYLPAAIEKYSKVKTILYRKEPVDLYDFYVDLELEYGDNEIVDSSDLNNLLRISHNLILTGIAGCGKSTLMKHLFLNSLKKGNIFIPIFIELRNINNTKMKLLDFIYDRMTVLKFNLEKKYFIKSLKTGRFIFFLDGFDEIDFNIKDSITKQLLDFQDKYSDNCFIISSRPDELIFVSWSNFTEFKIKALTQEKSYELVKKLKYDNYKKSKFLDNLKQNNYHILRSFISNPLLLIIMLMTFDQFGNIPRKTCLFYEQAFDTLFFKHDATKAGYKRVMFSDLPSDNFKKVLAGFSILTCLKNEISFNIRTILDRLETTQKITNIKFNKNEYFKDLLESVCILVLDGLTFTYSHRTFQEYFAAYYILYVEKKHQQKLVKKIAMEGISGRVLDLLYEMDSDFVEINYIIPILKDMKEKINEEFDENYSLLKLCFGEKLIIINNKGFINLVNPIGNIYLQCLGYINKHYKKRLHRVSGLSVQHFFNENLDYFEKYKFRAWKKESYEYRIDLKIILQNKKLYKYIMKIYNKYVRFYSFSMKLLGRLEEKHYIKNKSIEEILLD